MSHELPPDGMPLTGMQGPPALAGECGGWTPARYVAIDWSGARGRRYRGIAVAVCPPGHTAPTLVDSPAGWWSRQAVHDWLAGLDTALVGIDCAFSLPFAVAARSLPPGATVFELWERVEAVCAADGDFLGAAFAAHPDHAGDFWSRGRQPDGYADPHRLTEWQCRRDGYGAPQSPYKLIGAKQVGRGALAGMRMLRALRRAAPDRVAVWPFDAPRPGQVVFVEIYPRLFLMRAGYGTRKIRDGAGLDGALSRLESRPLGRAGPLDDHATDALVSAAGLRWLAGRPAVWAPPALDEAARRREGGIFGVGDRPIP